jgi:hypothetical protein
MEALMKKRLYPPYIILGTIFISFIIFAFIVDSPLQIYHGLIAIFVHPDILVADYMAIGGIGATFVNSGLLGLLCILFLMLIGIKPNGSTIMALWLITGFALFGKNLINVWPVMFGVWLYSKYQKESFRNYVLIGLLCTTLAPTVTQFAFAGNLPVWQGVIVGILAGIGVGFLLPPLTTYCMRLHQGYNLYNAGFSAGLLGTLLMSVLRAFNVNFQRSVLWHTGDNTLLAGFLILLFSSLIILGFIMNNRSFKNLRQIMRSHGRLVSDFYIMFENSSFINMGLLGLAFTLYILLIKGDLNGPSIGGIFTIVGFGAFGKHLGNVLPILGGAVLSSLFNIWDINSPEMILSTLFGTTLAPIAGHFGWPYGIIAGFLHVSVVMNTGYLHGGLNLYNNGFAGGIVAIILIPIFTAFRKESGNEALKSSEH